MESLKEVSAAVAAQAQARQGDAGGAGASAAASGGGGGGASLDSAEAAWRETGDGAKWLECLDDADVAGAERKAQRRGDHCWGRGTAHICLLHTAGTLPLRVCSSDLLMFLLSPLPWPCAVAERRVGDALGLLRRLEKLLQRFVAAADAQDPAQQARLDSMAGEVERRRERLIGIAQQQVLQVTV